MECRLDAVQRAHGPIWRQTAKRKRWLGALQHAAHKRVRRQQLIPLEVWVRFSELVQLSGEEGDALLVSELAKLGRGHLSVSNSGGHAF